MKKSLFFLLFLAISLSGFSQQDNIVNNETEIVDTEKTVKAAVSKVSASAKMKAKVSKMNRKKSNEIISIKAYRKSLQIKVKTKKL